MTNRFRGLDKATDQGRGPGFPLVFARQKQWVPGQADNIVDYGPGVDDAKIRKKLSEVGQVFLPVYQRLRGVFPAEDVPKFERVLDHLQRNMLRMRREFGYDLFI